MKTTHNKALKIIWICVIYSIHNSISYKEIVAILSSVLLLCGETVLENTKKQNTKTLL